MPYASSRNRSGTGGRTHLVDQADDSGSTSGPDPRAWRPPQSQLRDEALLESALNRPRQRWSYEPEADLASLAAAYGYGFIKNHPFLDGNKRIGFVAINMLLILNGLEIEAEEPNVVSIVLRVAPAAKCRRSG